MKELVAVVVVVVDIPAVALQVRARLFDLGESRRRKVKIDLELGEDRFLFYDAELLSFPLSTGRILFQLSLASMKKFLRESRAVLSIEDSRPAEFLLYIEKSLLSMISLSCRRLILFL